MKILYTLTFLIKSSIVLLLFSSFSFAQEEEEIVSDTLVFKQKYGLRFGVDLSKLVRTVIDDDYTGFEIIGDYRLTKKIYLSAEIGNEEHTTSNEVLNNTTKGSYFKAGIDYNLYKNWLDMENLIYVGFRVGASTFSQTLNSFDVFNFFNQYWDNQVRVTQGTEFDGLTAIWGELQFGIKAELLNNFFAGINVQLKYLVSDTAVVNFENLYIPGFNRTYNSGSIGVGYGFNISYLIPIFKKNKVVIQENETSN